MDNKLSELSKPVGFIEQSGMAYLRSGADADIWPDGGRGDDIPLYSQEYVSALLAERDAWRAQEERAENAEQELSLSRDRIAELEAIATDYAGKFQKAQDAAKHLIIMNDSAQAEIARLKSLLATPVRLPEPCVYEVNGTRFYDRLSEAEVIASLREQGFTVEGG
ncbi:hypothetical protein ACUNDX_06730 [Serratia sp. IR-2025]